MSFTRWFLLLIGIIFFAEYCRSKSVEPLSIKGSSVKDSVKLMMVNLSGDLAVKGPLAWLDYFENSTDFFMASDGSLAFPDYPSAKSFIENKLAKSIKHIDLHWNHLRVDPLTPSLASVGADYHEDLTDSVGKLLPGEGYFTALAEETSHGWQLRNLHWSIIKPKNP